MLTKRSPQQRSRVPSAQTRGKMRIWRDLREPFAEIARALSESVQTVVTDVRNLGGVAKVCNCGCKHQK